jgi:HEAT repeat protein
MKPLSDRAVALLEQICSAPKTAAGDRVRLVGQVGECHEAAAVVPLIRLLFDRSREVAASASDAIHRLLAAATPDDLLGLDERVRREACYCYPGGWPYLQPGGLPALPWTAASPTSVLGLATFHPSGYVREQAIRLLAGDADEAALPYLLIRLNDWVANVRQAARQAVERRLQAGPIDPLVRNLGLVLRLTACGREHHAGLVAEVLRRLTDRENAPALAEVIRRGERPVARHFFRLAVERPGPHLLPLLQEALRSGDGVLRLWAARQLLATEAGRRLEEALAVLRNDTFMPVRREVLAIRLQALPETAVPALKEALLDRSPSVRQFSRFHLGRLGEQDFAAFYREALATGNHREAALGGLGETGTQEDAGLVAPFVTTPVGSERRAAVQAVGKLAGEEHVHLLLNCLADASPKVTREVQQALRGRAGLLDPETLWAVFADDSRTHVRLAALALLDGTATWKGLPYLIRAAADGEQVIARRVRSYVERRYNRVFTTPTAEERGRIDLALEECAGLLDPGFLKGLRYRLGR